MAKEQTGTDGQAATSHEHVVDVESQRIARVYAEALLNAAQSKGQAQAVLEELESLVRDLFAAYPNFETLLSSSAVGRDRKVPVLRKAFDGRASDVFVNFLMVLNEHERLYLLRPVLQSARELYNERNHRIHVQVRTATPLPSDQADRLRQQLRDQFHLEPLLETRVDPDLLGGMTVRVGDWLFDASVRTQLDTIRNQLIERSSYEIQSGRDRFRTADGD